MWLFRARSGPLLHCQPPSNCCVQKPALPTAERESIVVESNEANAESHMLCWVAESREGEACRCAWVRDSIDPLFEECRRVSSVPAPLLMLQVIASVLKLEAVERFVKRTILRYGCKVVM